MKTLLKSAPVQSALAWGLALYVRLTLRTQLWRVTGAGHFAEVARSGEAVIAAFWHETLPVMPILWRVAKQQGIGPTVVLASKHRDGQMIGNIMVHLGLGLVSGSSSKGGAASFRALTRLLKSGTNVAITPDGPRGPRRVAAPGVAQLAGLARVRVIPCGAFASRAITLKSWDSMRLTLPFGRAHLVIGAPIALGEGGWQAALPAIEAAITAAQNESAR